MTDRSRLTREMNQYIHSLRQEGLTEKYVLEQARILKRFRALCRESGVNAPGRISLELVKEFLLGFDHMSVTWQKTVLVTIKGFLTHAKHPAALGIRMRMTGTSRTRIRWLSDEHIGRIFQARMKPATAVMIHLGLLMGLRMCEILRIRWTEAENALAVGFLQVHGKGYRARPVPLHPDVHIVLAKYMATNPTRRDKDLLLGFGKSRAEDLLEEFVQGNQLNHFSFHDMRRTCALKWFEARDKNGQRLVELETISEILGHSDLRTTKQYIGVNLRHMMNAMRCIRAPQEAPVSWPQRS